MAAWKYIGERRKGEKTGVRMIEGIPARDLTSEEVEARPEWAERLERSLQFVVVVTKTAGTTGAKGKDRPE